MAITIRDIDLQTVSVRIFNWRAVYRLDWLLSILVILIALVGWATLFSASRTTDPSLFTKQVSMFFIGGVFVAGIVMVDYRFVLGFAPLMYVSAIILLLAVEFFGYSAKGSERWLYLGPVRIQPSEMSKLIMIYTLAWYLTAVGDRIRKLHWFLLTFLIVGLPMGLILKQPNLGTAASLAPLVIVMLWVAGCRFWHMAVVILLGLSVFPVVWMEMKDFDPAAKPYGYVQEDASVEVKTNPESLVGLKDYQKRRIYAFLHPDYDPKGSGWHTTQSKITVGSGGLSGKGYMQGTQTRLNYLPEHHTDFIFSLLAEEQGFIGVAVVIGLYAAFLLRGLMFARDCPDMTGTLLATGVVTILAFHIFVNIAITVGLMPVTGIPLPFLSYGRSFYLTTMLCVGVLLSVPARKDNFDY